MQNNKCTCLSFRHKQLLSIIAPICIAMIVLFISVILIESIIFYHDYSADMFARKMSLCVGIGLVISFLFTVKPNITEHIGVLGVALCTIIESINGLSQIYGNVVSNNPIFILTGSFLNPGPYGGYMAVMACIITAWLVKKRQKIGASIFYKIECIILVFALLLAIVVIPASQSRAAILALCCSLFFLALSEQIGRSFIRRQKYVLIFFVAILLVAGYLYKKPSADGRMMIYKIDFHALVDGGLFGSGLGHFAGAYGTAQYNYFSKDIAIKDGNLDFGASSQNDRLRVDCPEFAFNDTLQIGIEAGIIAMLLYLGMIVFSSAILYLKQSPFAYGLIALTVFGTFSYPICLWQFQLLLTFFISVAISLSSTAIIGKCTKIHTVCLIIPLLIIILRYNSIVSTVSNYKEWKTARYLYYCEEYGSYVECCLKIDHSLEHIDDYLFEYGNSLAKIGDFDRSDSIFNNLISISCNPNILLIKGDNCMARNDYAAAEQLYIDAFILVPNRLAPLCRLANLYAVSGDTLSLRNMKRSIEHFIPRIESTLTESLREQVNNL